MILTIDGTNWKIVDARNPASHEALIIELPVFIATTETGYRSGRATRRRNERRRGARLSETLRRNISRKEAYLSVLGGLKARAPNMNPTIKPITAANGPKTNTLVIAASTERSCTLDENQSIKKYPAKAAIMYPPKAQRRPIAKRFIGSSRRRSGTRFGSSHRRHCGADDSLRFGNDRLEVALVAKALGVDFADVLGARRARRKPPALRHNL